MADQHGRDGDRVTQLFDAKAVTWSAKYAPGGRLAGRLIRLASALSRDVPAGGRLLDLGCGTGNLAVSAAGRGLTVTACDISSQMLDRAATADTGGLVDWIQLCPGWQALPFAARSFDAVVASSVLEYVDEPAAVLREVARVLRPGGIALCTVPDLTHSARWLEWLARPAARLPWAAAAGRRWPRLGSYLAYLQVSRHRRRARWWDATGEQAGLRPFRLPGQAGRRSPLRLLAFRRPGPASGEPA